MTSSKRSFLIGERVACGSSAARTAPAAAEEHAARRWAARCFTRLSFTPPRLLKRVRRQCRGWLPSTITRDFHGFATPSTGECEVRRIVQQFKTINMPGAEGTDTLILARAVGPDSDACSLSPDAL
jgi:hypothetical protein